MPYGWSRGGAIRKAGGEGTWPRSHHRKIQRWEQEILPPGVNTCAHFHVLGAACQSCNMRLEPKRPSIQVVGKSCAVITCHTHKSLILPLFPAHNQQNFDGLYLINSIPNGFYTSMLGMFFSLNISTFLNIFKRWQYLVRLCEDYSW